MVKKFLEELFVTLIVLTSRSSIVRTDELLAFTNSLTSLNFDCCTAPIMLELTVSRLYAFIAPINRYKFTGPSPFKDLSSPSVSKYVKSVAKTVPA